MRPIFIFLVAFGCALASSSHADQETFLKRAVWSNERVWLLTDRGQLFSVSKDEKAPRDERLGAKVLDICVSGRHLYALVDQGQPPGSQWQIRHREGIAWVRDLSVPVKRTKEPSPQLPLAITCDNGVISILTKDRLLTIQRRKITELKLKGKLGLGVTTVLATPDKLYVGYNKGEWGGGLQSVDRTSGVVKRIENKIWGSECGGYLRTDCDPVNGLVLSPWKRGCVVAAIGLQHMLTHGRIVEVCDGDVKRVYFKNNPRDFFGEKLSPPPDPSTEDYSTIAFFGVAVSGRDILAVGSDYIYRVHREGNADLEPKPEFKMVGPFRLSFGRNDVVLVLTSINQRHSLSGQTPILVPRHDRVPGRGVTER